jgi:hypothetical protein
MVGKILDFVRHSTFDPPDFAVQGTNKIYFLWKPNIPEHKPRLVGVLHPPLGDLHPTIATMYLPPVLSALCAKHPANDRIPAFGVVPSVRVYNGLEVLHFVMSHYDTGIEPV